MQQLESNGAGDGRYSYQEINHQIGNLIKTSPQQDRVFGNSNILRIPLLSLRFQLSNVTTLVCQY